jgi:transposase
VKKGLIERGVGAAATEPDYKYVGGEVKPRRSPFWSRKRGFKYIDDVEDHLRRLFRSFEILDPRPGSSVFEIGPGNCYFRFMCRELRGCRVASPALTPAARRSVARTVRLLEREADKVRAEADALVAASATLRADRELLETIPGVGRQTAFAVLAELPAVAQLPSAASAAAACGLAPREHRSGTSVKKRTRLSKAGNARLRKALYLPTLTAIRFNPLLQGFYERLVAAGKPKMQAVGACMRKLVMLCYGVLKNRAPFDPQGASKKAP